MASYPALSRDTDPVVVGYLPAFKGLGETIDHADTSAFTHFNIAFANPDSDGAYIASGSFTCMNGADGAALSVGELRETVRRLQEGGAKVLVSLGGGVIPECSGDWRSLLAPDRRSQAVDALIGLADALGLDGIDVDIEGALLTAIDTDGNYTPFVAALSARLREKGKLLTCATASYEGGMIPVDSIPSFDLVNVMSYDAVGPTWGEPGVEHASQAMAARDLQLWLDRGVAPDRLVLGVPFYGYGFNGEAPNWSYRDIANTHDADGRQGDVVGSLCATCRHITFNGPETIERKARLAREIAGGVMVWELSQDTDDHRLTRALQRGLSMRTARNRD
ncbi:glycosyl hydrolase family 18 protein [Pelagerythrobacter sp.]|uniref:glycosyl hydrolase family 18 protein n=1 Tax=Pelagerythrobacter sp. TaxID=2800702 RepID=UPI0035AE4BF7